MLKYIFPLVLYCVTLQAAVQKLDNGSFNEFIENKWAIVDFYADWCGPCKKLKPIFEQVSKEFPEIAFGKVNTDEGRIASDYHIQYIPTMILFHNGKEVVRHVGPMTLNELRELLQLRKSPKE